MKYPVSNYKHGLKSHPLWPIINNQKQRCQNPNNPQYKNYGGRGIKFNFNSIADGLKWILDNLGEKPFLGDEIDRINNNGDYEPGNLKWSSRSENQLNKRKYKNCTSIYKGVAFSKRNKKWEAQITFNNKLHWIGYFKNPLLASLAYESCSEVLREAV